MHPIWFSLLVSVFIALSGCSSVEEEGARNDLPVRCLDKPEPGPCKKLITRYYYDYRYDSCRAFHYGGCKGRVPFESKEKCVEICLGGG